MAQVERPTVCEVEGENCKKEVQALCYHCSKNLCRTHLLRHAQLVEEKIQSELHALADKLNGILSKFNQLSISDDILEKPFGQLEQWRADAHKQIDQIVEIKRQEMIEKLRSYRETFQAKNEEQLSKLNSCKKVLTNLIEEADASSSQIKDLQQSINEAEKYLTNVKRPIISVVPRQLNCSVNIRSQFLADKELTENRIREFRIIYIRLNGTIRNYYVKANANETMSDLINNFIQQYTTVEELGQRQTNQNYMIDHLPKADFILPAEIYNHAVHLVYNNSHVLSTLLKDDIITFYETYESLQLTNRQLVLMPCLFRRKIDRHNIALPVFFSVPRNGCRGQDISDAINNIIGNFYGFNDNLERPLYQLSLQNPSNNQISYKRLDNALNDQFDFAKTNVSLIVSFDTEFIDAYERNCLDQFKF